MRYPFWYQPIFFYLSSYIKWRLSMTCSYFISIRLEYQKIMNPSKCFFIKVASLSFFPWPWIFLHNWGCILTDGLSWLLFRKTSILPNFSPWFLHVFMWEQLTHYVPSAAATLMCTLALSGPQVYMMIPKTYFPENFTSMMLVPSCLQLVF